MALTAAQETFSRGLAQATGLDLRTVRAWVAAENGPPDNPLNILTYSGKVIRYGTTDAALSSTLKLLRSRSYYAPILNTARQPNATVQDELRAIIASPWEGSGYSAGHTRRDGWRLFGAFRSLYPKSAPATTAATAGAGADADAPAVAAAAAGSGGTATLASWWDPRDWFDWPGSVFGWLEESAAKAALYLVLTVAALFLIVQGLTRSLGTSPLELAGTAMGARAGRAKPSDIPF